MTASDRPADRRSFDWSPLLVALALTLTALVLVPGEVYLANQSDLLIHLGDALRYGGVLALLAALPIAGGLGLLRGRGRERGVAMALVATLLCWVHGYVLVWSYGVLDGSGIAWSDYRGREVIDAALWVVGLAVAWWQAPAIARQARFGALALVAMQVISLVLAERRAYESDLDFFKGYFVEKDARFDFSTERNVVVFVVDEYQADIFGEAIASQPDYATGFDGFTYFPNTLAGFNFTEFAIPAILTGRIYDNQEPRPQFLREAYLGPSLPVRMQEAGYHVELYPWRGFANESVYYHEAVASNFQQRPISVEQKRREVARLVDLALFRCLPQFAKRWVHNDERWRLTAVFAGGETASSEGGEATGAVPANSTELGANDTIDWVLLHWAREPGTGNDKITTNATQPSFKFFHLTGIHVPIKFNRKLEHGRYPYTREAYSEHAEAYAKFLLAFVGRLKDAGIYDQTMIVIAGDHGSGRQPPLYLNPGQGEEAQRLNPVASRGNFQRDKARGAPLLLVKPFGARGTLAESQAPAAVTDIPATVLAAVGAEPTARPVLDRHPEFVGQSVFALPDAANDPRARYYGAMQWAKERSDYVNTITLWRVQGHVWEDASWSLAERLERPAAESADEAPE
ncbi:sulfatase-like hydrolase/transferase [Actomonas aquatica]|uniref:Sulfatase-like hydrolase/transferase n=1 Tax=Actomonas aquatica TaxID=2866162 RepID=A0ABZ1C641_9BACT|nr:sulfatase-like hydrolase/transferase [Opitutus sp. WL0086]WRQ85989.1 sulfatase-like hydrolase/transferase [Opitutus sp. WL0086]